MKKINSAALAVLAAVLFLLPGCGKEDPVTPQEFKIPDNLRLSTVYLDGKLYRKINYDKAGRVESIKEYDNGEFGRLQAWEYNEEGQVSQRWFSDAGGVFQVVWAYEYNQNGTPRQWLVYKDIFDDPTYGASYEYDAQGKLSARHYYSPSDPGKTLSYIHYGHDGNSNLASKRGYIIQQDASVYPYLEQDYHYDNPEQVAAIRKVIGDYLAETCMFLYSAMEHTNLNSDGSITAAYTETVNIEFNDNGLPASATVNNLRTHPQAQEKTLVCTYEYSEL